jgi:hypothetical protein
VRVDVSVDEYSDGIKSSLNTSTPILSSDNYSHLMRPLSEVKTRHSWLKRLPTHLCMHFHLFPMPSILRKTNMCSTLSIRIRDGTSLNL